jgi:hypothetical protein
MRAAENTIAPKTIQTVPVTGPARDAPSTPEEARTARTEEGKARPRPIPEAATAPKTAETMRGRIRKPAETKIFVPPRAPDDPGPESNEADDGLEIGPFRPSGAKA